MDEAQQIPGREICSGTEPDAGPEPKPVSGVLRRRGIFIKVFSYTLIFLVLMIAVTAAFFAQQFLSFYRSGQIRQLSGVFQPLIGSFDGKEPGEIAAIAGDFHENNQSFMFSIEDSEGALVYSTGPGPHDSPDFDKAGPGPGPGTDLRIIFRLLRGDTQYTLRGTSSIPAAVNYGAFMGKIFLVLGIMLVVCTLGAVFFARRITGPIMKLAASAKSMAKLEDVPTPVPGNDEIGQLARDIYRMYGALKKTITSLEREVERERAMEENRRAFFSAASHELKTPIAALRALVEGMLSNIGEYRDHRRYLRECLGLLDAQNRLVSEILEMVNLEEDRGEPSCESFDPVKLVSSVIAEYKPIAERRHQRIISQVSAPKLRADPRLLDRVLSNVLSNALQNSPEGETIRIWEERRELGLLRLCIFNPGARLGEESLLLFEPFFRGDPARTRTEGRSGLGLAIVKRALERMKISHALQNTEGGVLFWMDLKPAEDQD
jgi:two-component system sensor histidine kinase VanS